VRIAPAALLAIVALAGATAGFFAYRHYAPASSGLQPTAAVSAAPARPAIDTPALASAEAPAARIPEEVPDVQLQDLAGKRHALRDNSGHPRLYNFWATWCEPCRREIPLLNALQETYRSDQLQIVGIAVDFRDSVRDFLKTTRLRYELLVGEEDGLEAAQKFGMELALPFSVFADEHNRIIAVKIGELHPEEAEAILTSMRALRSGRTTLPEARGAIAEALKGLAIERAKQLKPK
jgi:thiol-disulfide isomerase/thioredoxin